MKKKRYAKIIKSLRESCGWSQSELARQLKVTPACINSLELGGRDPSLFLCQKLTLLFNISMDIFSIDNYFIPKVDAFYAKWRGLEILSENQQYLFYACLQEMLANK
jgi:DNA-binding XRE family transcriptional regulator